MHMNCLRELDCALYIILFECWNVGLSVNQVSRGVGDEIVESDRSWDKNSLYFVT